MDARLLDIVTGLASLVLFIVLLVGLPGLFSGAEGYAYILAFMIFIIAMGGAGYLINEKIT
jgi:hypothetical protein